MAYDPENKALEALETERDNLRVELAAARKVIAAGYGACRTCKFWREDDESRDFHERWPDRYPTVDGSCLHLGEDPETADPWENYIVSTPEDFGCVAHVKAPPSALTLPPLEIGEASTASRIVVTAHPFPIVHSNHLPTSEDQTP